jgi:uncharacterized protein with FMN-binding domain
VDDTQGITESISQKKKNNVFVPLAVVGLIVIAVVGVLVSQGQEKKEDASKTVAEVTQVTKGMDATVTSAKPEYKDGEYKAVGDYMSPGGAEHVGVTVTLKENVIKDAEVQTMGDRPNTMKFQGIFKDNFKPFVVGKNIDELKLDKVSASSLTPKGFNDALDKIKQEAKA